jgi:hypothetical protein
MDCEFGHPKGTEKRRNGEETKGLQFCTAGPLSGFSRASQWSFGPS